MKGLKIFNIIWFALICVAEAVIIALCFDCFALLFSGNVAGIIASLLIFISYLLIGTAIILILTIVLTITTKIKIKKSEEQNLPSSKFDKICLIVPWCLIGLNVIAFFVYLIVGKIK